MNPPAKLIPFGILNVLGGALDTVFRTSAETIDFIADCIESWWEGNRVSYSHTIDSDADQIFFPFLTNEH